VVEARETLPWQRVATDDRAAMDVPSPSSHPAESIGEDFIAHALEATERGGARDDQRPARDAFRAQTNSFPFSSWW
jgi:hypothetical protein